MDGGRFYAVLAENDVKMRKCESGKMVLGGGGRTKRTLRTGGRHKCYASNFGRVVLCKS